MKLKSFCLLLAASTLIAVAQSYNNLLPLPQTLLLVQPRLAQDIAPEEPDLAPQLDPDLEGEILDEESHLVSERAQLLIYIGLGILGSVAIAAVGFLSRRLGYALIFASVLTLIAIALFSVRCRLW
ncbi:MAG: hypothetical protein HC890_17225 [Chloroflexaceae bacterium]|nr:hypothetical protein [Chloroflexaceae bacterium]